MKQTTCWVCCLQHCIIKIPILKISLCKQNIFLKREILIKMKRFWQATLFGESASKAFIYVSNPTNDFEKFMNKFFKINDSTGKTTKELTDQGISLWKNEFKSNAFFKCLCLYLLVLLLHLIRGIEIYRGFSILVY